MICTVSFIDILIYKPIYIDTLQINFGTRIYGERIIKIIKMYPHHKVFLL